MDDGSGQSVEARQINGCGSKRQVTQIRKRGGEKRDGVSRRSLRRLCARYGLTHDDVRGMTRGRQYMFR